VTLSTPGDTHARAAASAITARTGARVSGRAISQIGLLTVRPAHAGSSLHALAQRLRSQPGVARVQAERRFSLRYTPNDPGVSESEPAAGTPPGTPLEWWLGKENLFAAWDISRGDGAKVAVIDTGIDGSHPDFGGRIARAVDLDDAHATAATYDEQGHGTHVASLACATGGDGRGLVGAGFGCSLLVFKTDLSDSSVAAAIVGATDQGADAINMSFGTDGSTPAAQPIVDAIDYAYKHNVVMVAAAADDPVAEQGDPPNVLQPSGSGPDITQGKGLDVTAATVGDTRASFAGYGSQISMAAYGAWQSGTGGPRGLLGAFPGNTTDLEKSTLTQAGCNCRATFDGDTRYAYLQGTSMAAPQVTAVAALMHHLNPDLSAADSIRILKQTARRPAGAWTPDLGWGILDADAALATARIVDHRAPTTSLSAPKTTHASSITLKLRSKDAAPPGCKAAGVKTVRVYRRLGKGKWTRIGATSAATLKVKLRKGSSYAFYSVGVDNAGNREAVPASPDARTRVS
jgi:serine protease